MPGRQLWIFKFACWTTFLAAALDLAGYFSGLPEPANEMERQLAQLGSTYQFALPGGALRTLLDLGSGLTLAVAVLLVTIGGMGLAAARTAPDNAPLMRVTARIAALGSLLLLVISMTHLFIVPTVFIALSTISYAVAAVRAPGA
jgi:hypothetical protein